jgi:hypothetical protein
MKISRVIVYVGVVTGVCGLKLNSGNTAAKEIGKRLDLTEISNIDDHLERYGKLDQVEILYLQNTDVSDIPQLVRKMPNLKEIDLSYCKHFTDISALSGLESLEELYLRNTDVSDISFLNAKLPKLKMLDLENTWVNDISALRGRELNILDLKNTPVTDISGLENVKYIYLTDPEKAVQSSNGKSTVTYYKPDSLTKEHLAACQKTETSQTIATDTVSAILMSTAADAEKAKKEDEAEKDKQGAQSSKDNADSNGHGKDGDTKPASTAGSNTPAKKPISGGIIALISVSIALVVGGGLSILYLKQPAVL